MGTNWGEPGGTPGGEKGTEGGNPGMGPIGCPVTRFKQELIFGKIWLLSAPGRG